jgi:hypothetical protein
MSLTIIDYLVLTNEDWEDSIELDDGAEDPEPLDLTGSSFKSQLRTEEGSLTVVLECSTDNGRLVIDADPLTGKVSFNVSKSMLSLMTPGVYVYDTVWIKPDLSQDTVAAGTVTVKRGITR